jgi:hypothetical protein
MRAECLELGDEAAGLPKRRILGPVGVAAAQLVVNDHPAIGPGETLERLQVEAAGTGPPWRRTSVRAPSPKRR